jgi:hypothetical protein
MGDQLFASLPLPNQVFAFDDAMRASRSILDGRCWEGPRMWRKVLASASDSFVYTHPFKREKS